MEFINEGHEQRFYELKRHSHPKNCLALGSCEKDMDFIRIDREAFLRSPNLSIDHAVEHTELASVVRRTGATWAHGLKLG